MIPDMETRKVLAHLAGLIDMSLASEDALHHLQVIAAHLGVRTGDVVSCTQRLSPLEGRLAGVLVDDLAADHPDIEFRSAYMRQPTWGRVDLGAEVRHAPAEFVALFPAGTALGVPAAVRTDETMCGGWELHVFTRREDRADAAKLLDLFAAGTERLLRPMRGHAFRVKYVDGLDLEGIPAIGAARADLVMPERIWAEIDACVHRHLDLVHDLLAADLGANRGILLAGVPGTGKTALVRVVAAEVAGRATVLVPDADVMRDMMTGLYDLAGRLAPSIVLLEDVDLVIGTRHGSHGATLAEFLAALDGPATPQAGIITIATTNDPDAIDPAARRAARLDRIVEIPLPDRLGRVAILDRYLRHLPVDVDTERVASATDGASGADLRELVRHAYLDRGRALDTADLLIRVRDRRLAAEGALGQYL